MSSGEDEKRRVLLVDGTEDLDGRLREHVTDAGFAAETVQSAGDCLSRLQRDDVDAILSASDLPDLDGLTLLRSIRVSYPRLPFFLVPAEGSESLAGEAVAAGANGYVPREDPPGTVLSRLRDALQQRPTPGGDREGHQRYRHLIETSPAPINVFDESGDSIWCNGALLDLLGFESREEFIGRSIFDVIHPDDHERARRELENVIERKESTGPTKMKLSPPDGGIRYVRVSTAIGSFLGADVGQAVAVDVTEREERDRQLQILDQWLRHNIRNEMCIIRGIAENIRRGREDDVAESAGRIMDHADRLVEQTNHERAIIEVLAPSSDRNQVHVDVTGRVCQQVSDCREEYPDADIEIGRADAFEAVAIPEVGRAVKELIENAVQHNDSETPTVDVEVARTGGEEGIVRVADDGPGIPEDEREYFSLDREIDQLHHGSGLGLVLVYWVVRLSGGDVSFTENDPRGSVVTITLPRASGE